MSKFKEALVRGKEARRRHTQRVDGDTALTDFSGAAKAWLEDVVVSSLDAAKADVAGDLTVEMDTALLKTKAPTPSVRFQIYREQDPGNIPKTFTVSVQVDGGVSVSAPGIVAKDVGNIGHKSDERFRNLVAELIEDAAKGA